MSLRLGHKFAIYEQLGINPDLLDVCPPCIDLGGERLVVIGLLGWVHIDECKTVFRLTTIVAPVNFQMRTRLGVLLAVSEIADCHPRIVKRLCLLLHLRLFFFEAILDLSGCPI